MQADPVSGTVQALSSFSSAPLIRRSYAHGTVDTQIPGWSLQCLQTSSGTLSGGSRELHAAGVQVLEEHYRDVVTSHYGMAPPDSLAFIIPVQMSGNGMLNGQLWRRDSICVWNTNREFDAVAPPTDILCVIVNRSLLVDHIRETEQIDLEPALLRANLVIATPAVRSLAACLGQLVTAAFDSDCDPGTPGAQAAIRQEVVQTLAPLLVEQLDTRRGQPARIRHLMNVRRAREIALAQTYGPPQVQDLCRELGLSRRTLQDSFRGVLGIGPLDYLHMLRLNGARRALLAGQTVRAATEAWGFWHWSRFSREYRQLFGELPSATAKRAGEIVPQIS